MKIHAPFLLFVLFVTANTRSFAQSPAAAKTNLDTRILLELAEDRTEGHNEFYQTISNITSPVGIAVPASTMIVGLITHNTSLKKKALYLTETYVANSLITYALKKTFNRSRPYVTNPSLVPLEYEKSYSFPSGHTSEAFSMATSLSLSFPKWYVIAPAFTFASLVGYSRMYLGVHYPSDVIAGALVGSGTAWLTYKANQWLHHEKRQRGKHHLVETY